MESPGPGRPVWKLDPEDLCLVVAASPRHRGEWVRRLARLLEGSASRVLGGAVEPRVATGPGGVPGGCRGLVVLLATGGTEHIVLDMVEGFEGPVAVAGVPAANSVSSLAEVAPLLRGRAHVRVLPDAGGGAHRVLAEVVRGVAAAAGLVGARVLLIGGASPWLVHGYEWLAARLGARVEVLGVDEFLEIYGRVGAWRPSRDPVAGAEGADLAPGEPERSLRVAAAVYEAARGYHAVSPACTYFLDHTGANACLAHFLQEEAGVVVGCEGDAVATLSLLLASRLAGAPAWQANLAGAWRDRLLLAHCAPPRWMARRYWLSRHFITGGSVTVRAELDASEATILRLPPMEAPAAIAWGPVLDSRPSRSMQCETQLLLEAPGEELLVEGTGNHYAVVPGDHVEAARAAVESLGLQAKIYGAGRA